MARLIERYPGAALVTGASAGIGAAFARRLAAEGYELALVARRAEALEKLAGELRAAHGVKVHVITQDLGTPDGPAQVKLATDALGLTVGMLVNNAGYGSIGLFHELDPANEARMIDLNCRGTMLITSLYAPGMVQRRNGAILITASVAGFQPCPYFATYAATKAFDLSFSNALWAELRPFGVDVTAVCPGYTRTEFQEVAGINPEASRGMRSPEQVVASTFHKLGKSPNAVDGFVNVLAVLGSKFAPRRAVIGTVYRALRKMA